MNKIDNLKVIGNEYRIRILCLLSVSPCTVSEITDILDISTANTSKYLKQLVNAKMINYLRLGAYNYYFLNFEFTTHFQDVNNIVASLQNEPQVINDREKLKITLNDTRVNIRSKLMFNNTELENLLIKKVHVQSIEDFKGVIDIREKAEYDLFAIEGTINIPMSLLLMQPEEYLDKDLEYKILCQTQTRSMHLAKDLKERGYDICVISGGIDYYMNNIN